MSVKSIADIAALAGVGKTTVSAVLNGKAGQYRISSETCEKILQIVKEHNYRPNRVARSLRTQKTHTIGLVVPDLTNCFFSDLTKSIEAVARQAGYQVLIASSEDRKDIEKDIIENFFDFSVDGMIVTSSLDDEEIKSSLPSSIPIVFIDRELHLENFFYVLSDHYKGALELLKLLYSESDEVAYIGRDLVISSACDRYQAYKDAVEMNGHKLNEDLVRLIKDNKENGYASLREIYNKLGRLPKALFTSSYMLFLGCLEFMREEFGEIPNDIKLATFDNTEELDFMNFKVHSVAQDCQALAKEAFNALIKDCRTSGKSKAVKVPVKVIKR